MIDQTLSTYSLVTSHVSFDCQICILIMTEVSSTSNSLYHVSLTVLKPAFNCQTLDGSIVKVFTTLTLYLILQSSNL